MEYISIDIETTGLDASRNQILEACFVKDDLSNPVFRPEILHFRLWHDELVGHPAAFKMNARLIARINEHEDECLHTGKAVRKAIKLFWPEGKANVAGKNPHFDLAFLEQYGVGIDFAKYRHRVLDPGILYMRADDTCIPDLAECCKRAGIDLADRELHTAREDALLVCQLLRREFYARTTS